MSIMTFCGCESKKPSAKSETGKATPKSKEAMVNKVIGDARDDERIRMKMMDRWRKEVGARIEGSRELDSSKVQAPGVVRLASGGFRLFYTAVGPAKPYRTCQGYILSAVSGDGVSFHKEPGIRLAPQPELSF